MLLPIIYFIMAFLIPYFLEEAAYSKLIPSTPRGEKTIAQGYGWRIVWDLAYHIGLIGAGYNIIFLKHWEWLGYVIFLAGILLRIWSLSQLREFYDPGIALRSDHRLVQTGPFRLLRHPLHVGTLLKISGLAFFLPLWIVIPNVIASLVLALYLNRTEDCLHLEKFGSDFQMYYLRSWDFVDLIFWKKK